MSQQTKQQPKVVKRPAKKTITPVLAEQATQPTGQQPIISVNVKAEGEKMLAKAEAEMLAATRA